MFAIGVPLLLFARPVILPPVASWASMPLFVLPGVTVTGVAAESWSCRRSTRRPGRNRSVRSGPGQRREQTRNRVGAVGAVMAPLPPDTAPAGLAETLAFAIGDPLASVTRPVTCHPWPTGRRWRRRPCRGHSHRRRCRVVGLVEVLVDEVGANRGGELYFIVSRGETRNRVGAVGAGMALP